MPALFWYTEARTGTGKNGLHGEQSGKIMQGEKAVSLLDEIRTKAKKKREAVAGEGPDKVELADIVVKLFSNTDYIEAAGESMMRFYLYYVGYDVREVKALYQRLMAEITGTSRAVSPEMLARILEEKKKAETAEQE